MDEFMLRMGEIKVRIMHLGTRGRGGQLPHILEAKASNAFYPTPPKKIWDRVPKKKKGRLFFGRFLNLLKSLSPPQFQKREIFFTILPKFQKH